MSIKLRTIRRSLGSALAVTLLVLGLGVTILTRCADTTTFSGDAGDTGSTDVFSGDLGPIADIYVNPCAPDPPPSVSGKVYAPNGVDPIAGASVHVPLGLLPIPGSVQCETCAVKGKFTAHTYAGSDGSFKLVGVPHDQKVKIGIQKGYFRRIIEVEMPECGQVTLPKEQTTLPGKNKQYGPWDTIPKIAVISGAWDKMEKVLDKLGVDPGELSIFNGKDYGTGPQSMQYLLQNAALLKSHHLVLINCGTKFEALVTTPGPARANIQEYVRAGGRLFVTDFSYDYVEQTFPAFIDFEGAETIPPDQPETHNEAEKGTQNLVIQADVLDDDLRAWLGLPEINALIPGGKIKIEGFMTGWAVQKAVNKELGTKVWVTAPVTWAGGSGVRPMTTTFDFLDVDKKGCGRVTFSSYHTWGEAQDLLPQERVLEYLILEIGTCIDIE
jgi:hypothetical protein